MWTISLDIFDVGKERTNKWYSTYINYALGTLFALRIGHAELGLNIKDSMGPGRIVGYFGTQAVLVALAGYTAYLVKDFLQIAA